MVHALKILSLLFLGTFFLNVLWSLFQPLVERKRPVRLARVFLCFQGAVLLVVGTVVGIYSGPSWPHRIWAGVCVTIGFVELFIGLRGSDNAVFQALYLLQRSSGRLRQPQRK